MGNALKAERGGSHPFFSHFMYSSATEGGVGWGVGQVNGKYAEGHSLEEGVLNDVGNVLNAERVGSPSMRMASSL